MIRNSVQFQRDRHHHPVVCVFTQIQNQLSDTIRKFNSITNYFIRINAEGKNSFAFIPIVNVAQHANGDRKNKTPN